MIIMYSRDEIWFNVFNIMNWYENQESFVKEYI